MTAWIVLWVLVGACWVAFGVSTYPACVTAKTARRMRKANEQRLDRLLGTARSDSAAQSPRRFRRLR